MKNRFYNFIRISVVIADVIIGNTCFAQSDFGEIRGNLTDSSSKASIEYADILLYKDGVRKSYTISDDQGEFFFKAIEPGIYSMTVKNIYYRDKQIYDISVSANRTTNLDSIPLVTGPLLPIFPYQCRPPLLIPEGSTRTISPKLTPQLDTTILYRGCFLGPDRNVSYRFKPQLVTTRIDSIPNVPKELEVEKAKTPKVKKVRSKGWLPWQKG